MKLLFHWLDFHPNSYWLSTTAALLVLGWWLFFVRQSRDLPGHARRDFWQTAVVLLGALLACRWPFLLSATEYNPDESQFLAGAITLTRDPVFWRSVDGTTSGPLNLYALLPLHWAGLRLDYFTARLTAVLLVWGTLLACYRTIALRYSERLGRWGILPLVIFFCSVWEWDFIHYSSEHVSLLLLAAAINRFSAAGLRPSWRNCFFGAVFAGMLPWAKLQGTPLGLAVVVWGYWSTRDLVDRAKIACRMALFSGAALPSLFGLGLTIYFGQWAIFSQNYLAQNLFYVAAGGLLSDTLKYFVHASSETFALPLLLLCGVVVLATAVVLVKRKHQRLDPFAVAMALMASLAFCCVFAPRRGSLHYALFLVIPFGLMTAAAVGISARQLSTSRTMRRAAVAFLLLAVALPCVVRFAHGVPVIFGHFSEDWRKPRSRMGSLLHDLAEPGDQLAVWGWFPRLYVESGMPQGTRGGETFWAIQPSRWRKYNQDLFMEDLKRSCPAYFVDAVGPEGYVFRDRNRSGHESVPALRDYVQKNYVLLVDLRYARAYVRRDRLDRNPSLVAKIVPALAKGRNLGDSERPREEDLSQSGLRERRVEGRQVRMMLPPSVWKRPLVGTERQLLFECGYDPVAWRGGAGNGTVLTVALRQPDGKSQLLWTGLLNPAHVMSDRTTRSVEVHIPEFIPGSCIEFSTAPGEYNDNAWDWLYIANVRFRQGRLYIYGSVVEDFGV